MRKVLFLSVIFFLSFAGLMAQDYSDNGGCTRVKNYYVGMDVHPDNTYSVTEEITAHFAEEHHGIYRYVPYVYGMFGKSYRLDITDIDVEGEPYGISDENDNVLIKIGSADELVIGDKKYIITYTIRNRDDRVSSCDMFYHSIIGDYFELPIDTLSFRILFDKTLPEYAKDSLQVFSGPAEGTGNPFGVKVRIENNTISGYVTNIPCTNAVTVRLRLPEGYYVGEDEITPTLAYIFFGVTLLFLIIIFYYEFTLKHPAVTKQIEFYPPDDMCSAEVGTVIDDSVDQVDLASLIPWFASRGYIRIDEKEEKKLIGTKKYLELTKLKRLPNNAPAYQLSFFDAIFSKADTVRLDDMPNVAKEIESVTASLNDIYKGDRKLTSWHWSVFLLIPLFFAAAGFLNASLPYKFMENDDNWIVFAAWTLPYVIGVCWVLPSVKGQLFRKNWVNKAMIAFRFVCMLFFLFLYLSVEEEQLVDYTLIAAVFVLCFAAVECGTRLNVNSKYRAGLIGKLLGLKEFIQTAEEPRLKSLLEDDPQYFYKILPYAMVFEISDIWADHFKNIEMKSPDWYNGTNVGTMFMTDNFVSSLSSATNDAIKCMAPSTSSDGGGGFSGGFSGGGTGGGGGGAW